MRLVAEALSKINLRLVHLRTNNMPSRRKSRGISASSWMVSDIVLWAGKRLGIRGKIKLVTVRRSMVREAQRSERFEKIVRKGCVWGGREDDLDNKSPRCLIDRSSSPNRRAGLLGFGLLISPSRGKSAPQAPIDIKATTSLLLSPSTRFTTGIIAYRPPSSSTIDLHCALSSPHSASDRPSTTSLRRQIRLESCWLPGLQQPWRSFTNFFSPQSTY